jgi:hypothetical protein
VCLSLKETGIVIPPGAEQDIAVHCYFGEAGAYEEELRLFTTCPGKPIVPVRVRAKATAKNDPTPRL